MADSFDQLVAEFMGREKMALHGPRWRVNKHPDYAAISMMVAVEGARHLRGRVIVTAHKLRIPPKYCFTINFRGKRVLALDVNPGRSHRNLLTQRSIGSTHWQRWPTMDADPDERDQTFSVWLHEFLVSANVSCSFRVASPPQGVQLELLNG